MNYSKYDHKSRCLDCDASGWTKDSSWKEDTCPQCGSTSIVGFIAKVMSKDKPEYK